MKKEKKPLLFRLIKGTVKIFYKKRKFVGIENLPKEPVIVVSNHSQLHGPLSNEISYPRTKRIWCIGQVMNLKEAPKYNFNDFWSKKPKSVRWLFKLFAYISAPLSVYIFSRSDTIPVYKDARIMSTFKETVKKIDENNDIIIFPECPTPYNDIINEFQDKFIDVARLYYKRTNKELYFVPAYNAAKIKTISLGKPIKFDSTKPIEEERKIICDYLKEQITLLAKELPSHKVVPYLNVGRKNYKKSK